MPIVKYFITTDQLEWVRAHSKEMTLPEMAAFLPMNERFLKGKMVKHGIPVFFRKVDLPHIEEYIIAHRHIAISKISKELGLSVRVIEKKIEDLDLGTAWAERRKLLVKYYSEKKYTVSQLATMLGTGTAWVYHTAKEMGLDSIGKMELGEKRKLLVKYSAKHTNQEIADLLNEKISWVKFTKVQLGISTRKKCQKDTKLIHQVILQQQDIKLDEEIAEMLKVPLYEVHKVARKLGIRLKKRSILDLPMALKNKVDALRTFEFEGEEFTMEETEIPKLSRNKEMEEAFKERGWWNSVGPKKPIERPPAVYNQIERSDIVREFKGIKTE